MKKLKFLLLALVATISLGAFAETDYTSMMSSDWVGSNGNFQSGKERYQASNYAKDTKVMYQSITAPAAGIYEIKFYAVTSSTSGRGFKNIYGDNIAVAYANEVIVPMTVIDQTGCTLAESGNIRTLSIEAKEGDNIEYGLKNIAEGGNWYTIQGISIKMKTVAEIYQSVYDEALSIYNNSDESVTGAKEEFLPYIEAMNTALTGTLAEAKAAAENLVVAQAIYMSKSAPTRGSGVKYDFTSKMNMAINGWTCLQGNGPAQYGFTGATETYSAGSQYAAGKVMYQTITGLANGEYEVQFYGVANSANGVSTVKGAGYAQAYANSVSQDIEVVLQNGCTPSEYLRTITCTVTDGTLEFGLKNVAVGGNWYLCKAVALYMTGGPNLDDYYSAIAENLATAKSIQSSGLKMQSDVKTALDNAVTNASGYETATVISELETMNQNLSDAIAAANKSIADYEALKNAYTLAGTLYAEKADGASDFMNAISTAQSGYTNADVDGAEATAAMKEAIETYLSANNTNIVVNGTFDSNRDGWTSTTEASGQGLATNKTGDFTGSFWENWNSTPKTGKMYQTNATVLPAGNYLLRIAAFGDQDQAYEGSNLYVYANDQKKAVVSDNPTYYYVPFTLTVDAAPGAIEYGLVAEEGNKSGWIGIDNISICFLDGMSNFYATEEDYDALAAALSAVSDKVFGFEADEYAPYNNVEAAKAIAIAKAIDPTAKNIAADVRLATETINNADWVVNETEVNAVYDGSFASAINNGAPAGWSMSNNTLGGDYHSRAFVNDDRLVEFNDTKSGLFLRFDGTNSNRGSQYFYGQTEGYTMPLKAETVYYVSVDAKNWGDATNKPLRLNVTGPSGFTAVSQDLSLTSDAATNNDEPQHFLIVFTTATAGNYHIGFQCPGADTNAHNALISNVELKKAASFDATLTKIGDAAYSTMYLDYPVEIPTGVEAYYVTVEGKTATMNAIEGVIPANCGVILKAEDAGKVTFTQTSTAATTDVSDNVLIGFVKDTEVNNSKAHYAFSYKDDKVAFYIPASAESDTDPTSKFTAKANKAYLEIEGTSSSKIDIAWGGEVTGINAVNGEMGTKDGLYNINGMRVNSNYKGIVLKGNKKFLQK